MPKLRSAALLGVAALLVAEHHAGLAVEARQAADDRQVVGECAVAVQLLEVGEDLVDVVQRVRAAADGARSASPARASGSQ